jgi:hypothetical protein
MHRSRWLLAAGLAVVVALLVVPAIVLAGRDSSTPTRSQPKVEQLRAPAAAHLEHRRCGKRMERYADWPL